MRQAHLSDGNQSVWLFSCGDRLGSRAGVAVMIERGHGFALGRCISQTHRCGARMGEGGEHTSAMAMSPCGYSGAAALGVTLVSQ
jgi:hypothetical protein